MAQARTLFDKIWDQHVVRSVGEGVDLLHVDRHLLHDLSGARALSEVREKGHQVHSPQLALSTPDHTLSTAAGRDELAHDPRLSDNPGRVRHQQEVDAAIAAWTSSLPIA
ncbi:MAG: aconitase family protein, partial [Pseudomonadota bacterium]|nr:aconitase family protein [Pseudomonadota bacterium]